MTQSMARESAAKERVFAPGRTAKLPLGPHTLLILLVAASLVLAALPLAPELFGAGKTMDYPLWYWVGRQVLSGGDLYVPNENGAFGFLYPPLAALLMAPLSLFGRSFSILCIVLVNLASWWAAIALCDRLSGEKGPKAWWVVALPSALSMPLIFDTFNLGQPNLMLLALMLAGLALLQSERQWSAGALFALATALKAFPVAVLPYLLWRRRWRAAAAMTIGLGVFLLIVPAP
ncbi:MAG TPA: glycosyltransferase family 87 protein, partial [Roseiarcus sp.]|nr:glycosyltransferase family 87 protein [Roseiarcus sp.]